uniref:Ribosomal protein S3 n=1 Tax=Neogoniolithon spectabile TaxID=231755 RepID=A0A3G3MIM3_9FLOR|nr:ribosomal protein S3 [Neogoniolithon spectabile]AYR06659.1 ribosomal protein S3 [Neogoniolithon spectabile]
MFFLNLIKTKSKMFTNKSSILQTTKYNLNTYGSSFSRWKCSYYKLFYIYYYTHRLFHSLKYLLISLELRSNHNKLTITVTGYNFKKDLVWNKLKRVIPLWQNVNLDLHLYNYNTSINSALIIFNYIKYLTDIQKFSLKQAIQEIDVLIQSQNNNNHFKIIHTSKGLKRVGLIGYKIQIKGCYEASVNQMSKTSYSMWGRRPANTLNNHIEYSKGTLFTKYGSCGIKIWLFYTFLSINAKKKIT